VAFARTLENLRHMDLGFNQENVTLFDLQFARPFDIAQGTWLFKELLSRLGALPPVHSAPWKRSGINDEGRIPNDESKVWRLWNHRMGR